MCQQCGCTLSPEPIRIADQHGTIAAGPLGTHSVEILSAILGANDRQAAHNREHLAHHGVLAVNLMSAPGSGKTSLLEGTIDALQTHHRIAVIEGDLETDNDARRVRAKGVPAIQITTGQTCHLDALMVHEALHALELDAIDLLFIENVGNLVCPASFDLGQSLNVTLLAVTEGDDKPSKYPAIFRRADLVALTKTDLLDVLGDFDPERAQRQVRALASDAPVLQLSSRRPATLQPWTDWLEWQLRACRTQGLGSTQPGRAAAARSTAE